MKDEYSLGQDIEESHSEEKVGMILCKLFIRTNKDIYILYTYIHTYMHTYINTYIYTYLHTYIHTNAHTYIHAYKQTYIHTHDIIL